LTIWRSTVIEHELKKGKKNKHADCSNGFANATKFPTNTRRVLEHTATARAMAGCAERGRNR
jgi:hypothetical protein